MAKGKMTTCSHCGAEIAAGAKTCPKCGGKIAKPVYKRIWFWILIVLLVLGLAGAVSGGGSDKNASSPGSAQNQETVQDEASAQEQEAAKDETIEYTAVTVDQMTDALNNNPAAASDEYKDKYFAVTGKLSTIDSSGKYISLSDINDEWDFTGITCYIKNDEQLNAVKQMTMGQEVTVRGKVTDVGEVLGYYLDIDSID